MLSQNGNNIIEVGRCVFAANGTCLNLAFGAKKGDLKLPPRDSWGINNSGVLLPLPLQAFSKNRLIGVP